MRGLRVDGRFSSGGGGGGYGGDRWRRTTTPSAENCVREHVVVYPVTRRRGRKSKETRAAVEEINERKKERNEDRGDTSVESRSRTRLPHGIIVQRILVVCCCYTVGIVFHGPRHERNSSLAHIGTHTHTGVHIHAHTLLHYDYGAEWQR